MKKNLLLFTLNLLSLSVYSQIKVNVKLVDKELGIPIPFASVIVNQTGQGTMSNPEGFFTLLCNKTDSVTISHIAYTSLKVNAEQLLRTNRIEMQEQVQTISPIVVSASAARKDIQRAIDSTFKTLNTVEYIAFHQTDKIIKANSVIAEISANIYGKVIGLRKAGKGTSCILKASQFNMHHNYASAEDLNEFDFLPLAYINTFGVGINNKHDTHMVFSFQEGNDSLVVISFHPKKSYSLEKENYALLSGQITINRVTWRIREVHFELDSITRERINRIAVKEGGNKKRFVNYTFTMQFNKSGLPINFTRDFTFTRQNQNKKEETRHLSIQVYSSASETEYNGIKTKINGRKTLFTQKKTL